MKKLSTLVLSAFLFFACGGEEAPKKAERFTWIKDYDEAIALAKETGKPLLLEFRCAP